MCILDNRRPKTETFPSEDLVGADSGEDVPAQTAGSVAKVLYLETIV